VRVQRFRYIDRVVTSEKTLLQVSSEIVGDLPADWHGQIGDIFAAMLPAGSVTGAPKRRTLEILHEAEQYERGYYTGIAGYYDGRTVDSCVLIRYLERDDEGYVFKSGGGITCFSDPVMEYQELLDKVALA
jgi:para-aminobenzoate synthetase component 1